MENEIEDHWFTQLPKFVQFSLGVVFVLVILVIFHSPLEIAAYYLLLQPMWRVVRPHWSGSAWGTLGTGLSVAFLAPSLAYGVYWVIKKLRWRDELRLCGNAFKDDIRAGQHPKEPPFRSDSLLFWVAGFMASVLCIGACGYAAYLFGNMSWLWWLWDLVEQASPRRPSVDNAGWKKHVAVVLLYTAVPLWFASFNLTRRVTWEWMVSWSIHRKVVFIVLCISSAISIYEWRGARPVGSTDNAQWLTWFAVGTAYVVAFMFWYKFAEDERQRVRPPYWVGAAEGDNPLFLFWQGLVTPLKHGGGWLFEGGWKGKPEKPGTPLGGGRISEFDETYEAGL